MEQLGKYVKIRDLLFLSNTTLKAIMSVTSVKTFTHLLEVHWGPIGLTVRPSLQGAHPPVQLQQKKRVCGLYMVVGALVFFSWFDLISGL